MSLSKFNLKSGSHIHLMGICGTAMASLAGLLKDRGYKVTGSDSNPYPPMSTQLERLGISIMKGYRKENLSVDPPDFVIVGNVISASNEEAQELVRLKIPFTSLPKAVGELIIDHRDSYVVAGTHGKTTTTSLLAWVSQEVGLKPGFLIGGIPKNFTLSFRNPEAQTFVIEGDEYDTAYFDKVPKFIHYKPKHVIFTSLEFDHADIYSDLQAIKAAFSRLMGLIPAEGSLFYCADEKNVVEVQADCQVKAKFGYGLKKGDYLAKVLGVDEHGTDFEVHFHDLNLGRFRMILGGDYNVLNATAVVGLSHQRGWNLELVRSALLSFQGVKRRQEVLGEPGGVLVIEDFAHHPTAVRETIRGIQKTYPQRRFFSVFEPRSATSRRKVFQQEYVEAFRGAQEVVLAEAFDQTKIDSENRFSSAELVHDLQALGRSAHVFQNADEIVQDLLARAKPGDGILIMSNGGFDGIYGKLIKGLEARG